MKISRVVFDTNVLISAIVFRGAPRKILEYAIHGEFKLCLSPAILRELQGVLEGPKFQFPAATTLMIENEILSLVELVTPIEEITAIISDPDDNRILECAVAASADIIVSEDQHLLELVDYRGIRIFTVKAFLEYLHG